ncbi:hypothetical protein ABB26_16845 [Stenotrophomonas humi]|uniref:Uncharacterized protein n=1 Tax=Stenotrophomonas humi TaxID=405444 RepID=A0A0R0C866_9GAMM|nr:hypothetical protein ABB26_16845 [Stenotrophomonas humi]
MLRHVLSDPLLLARDLRAQLRFMARHPQLGGMSVGRKVRAPPHNQCSAEDAPAPAEREWP